MSNYDYDNNQQGIIYYTVLACSILSIFGCIFIIILYIKYPNLQKLPFRLIFYLTISDLGTSLAFSIPYMTSYYLCQIQGGMISYFTLSSVLWCACLAHAISTTVLKGIDIDSFEKHYCIIGFIIPLLTLFVLIDIHNYNVASGWCWIYQDKNPSDEYYRQVSYRLVTFYVPLFIVLIYIFVQYIKVIHAIKDSLIYSTSRKEVSEKMILKLRLYPLILFFSQLPVIVIRFMSFFRTEPEWYIVLIAGTGTSLNGFLNSIVYGLTQEIKHEIFKACCMKKGSEMLSLVSNENNA